MEAGKKPWKELLHEFYGGFEANLTKAEKDLEGVHLKVPDEVSEEKCDLCGRNMVIKTGRFGRFLACPGYPDCKFTKPLVVEMPGRCPKCGGRLLKKTSRKGYAYYGCDRYPNCDFMTWDVPVKDDCPSCGQTMFKRSGRGFKKPFCINPACPRFLPEDQRGYPRKKPAEEGAETAPAAPEDSGDGKKTAARKPAAKKTTAKKTAVQKPTAKKTAEKKTAAKKPAEKKTAARKAGRED